jgi:diaminopimelate decarboxylase
MNQVDPSRSTARRRIPAGSSAESKWRRHFWLRLAVPLTKRFATPFHLFSLLPFQARCEAADRALTGLPVRHWWSAKTLPLPTLWQWWRDQGRPIEVVSEFELRAALAAGFPPDSILVNGPAKHHWLDSFPHSGLNVNFDSLHEVAALVRRARQQRWRVGLRLAPTVTARSNARHRPGQFGMTVPELKTALQRLRRAGLEPEILHFHLGTQIESANLYAAALAGAAAVCRQLQWFPRFVDCGGGWPTDHVQDLTGRQVAHRFSLTEFARILQRARAEFPALKEYWLENGRWFCAPAGALVVRVLDVKPRGRIRYLICDGGRTIHAMISTWETHTVLSHPVRRGRAVSTVITGPTCMTFDVLAECPLPENIRPGDFLVWLDAGAYNLSWETRFSHGSAPVLWHDGRTVREIRPAETFDAWWGRWRA